MNDCVVQGGAEFHGVDRLVVQIVAEHLIPVAALVFGALHGDIGIAQQFGRFMMAGLGHRDADAGADEDLMLGDGVRAAQRVQQPLGYLDGVGDLSGLLQQNGELIAPQPGDRVAGTDLAS